MNKRSERHTVRGNPMPLLANHIAVITGAGSGIGRAIAIGHARVGARGRALAVELGKEGVRVNAIGPGFIETPLNAATRANNLDGVRLFIEHTPLGRAGQPEDIVGPAIFLASDLSAYVTGSIVMADGGYRAV